MKDVFSFILPTEKSPKQPHNPPPPPQKSQQASKQCYQQFATNWSFLPSLGIYLLVLKLCIWCVDPAAAELKEAVPVPGILL